MPGIELQIVGTFELADKRVVFACEKPATTIPNKNRYEAYIKPMTDGQEPLRFSAMIERPRGLAEKGLVAFSTHAQIELDEAALESRKYILVVS